LSSSVQICCFISFSPNTGHLKKIGPDEAILLSEALKSNTSLTHLNLLSKDFLLHFIFSLNTENGIRAKGASELSEALKSNSTLTSLVLHCNTSLLLHFFSLNTANLIGDEGAIKLSEALTVNTSLTDLDLSGNRLTASFHSQSKCSE
jgi:hypothetical protein